MTTKTTMPEPVLTRRVFHPSTGEVEQHLITTDQAEAYANARVRGTLEYEITNLLSNDFKMSTERPVPRKMIYRSSGEIVVKEVCTKTAKALDKLYEDVTTLRGDYEELESDLRNLLNSVTTFKQLEAAWPEGKALYDKHKPKPRTTSVVDAGLAVKLTQALTPPLGARP